MQCGRRDRAHVHGYKGKQVRDNIQTRNVARFIYAFIDRLGAAAKSTTSAAVV